MKDDAIGKIVDIASAKSVERGAWFARLHRNAEGAVLPTASNALMIFANDPWLTGLLCYNDFTSRHLLARPPPAAEAGDPPLPGPYPRSWEREDVVLIQSYLQRVWSPRFAPSTVEDAMCGDAVIRRFHPVTDWLDTLVWDGKSRIDTWLSATFDCDNSRYHRTVGAKFLIAAVRRIRHPGCKFDHMLVLEGAQGIGKSRALTALFTPAWYSDDIPPDLRSRDAALALLGVWCLEFAEIEHLIRHEVETIKAFLSRTTDRYRPPYGKHFVERPRQGVLVGTTNLDDYLRDPTGNRRIWPVRCRCASPDWVAVNRDQVWAEAAVRELRGETIWLDGDEVVQAASAAQTGSTGEDPWEPLLAEYLLGKSETRVHEILIEALSVPKDRLTKAFQMRVADILRTRGWKKDQARREGKPTRLWFAPGQAPADTAGTDCEDKLIRQVMTEIS